ncbi:YbfB/YjiJ family MFS transporter [Achromobacter denitrificans]
MASPLSSCSRRDPTLASSRSRVILAGLSALILAVGLARFAYTPMLPVMRTQAGLENVAAGWLATSNYLGYMLGALFAATVGDLAHKYRLYKAGLITAVLTTLGMGLTDNILAWAALRFLSGASSTAGLLLASGLVLNWLIKNGFRPELGLHFVGMGVGIMVSGIAVAMMAGHLSWRGQWIALGIMGAAFFVPAWAWMPAPDAAAPAQAHPRNRDLILPRISLLEAAYFCAGFGYVISATFVVAMLEQIPALQGKGSWIWVVVGIAAAPSCFVWDRIAAHMGQTPALMLAFLVQAAAFALPAIDGSALSNVISAILFGGTFVGIVGLSLSIVGRQAPTNPAKAMARLTVGYGIAQIIGPAVTGYMAHSSGSYAEPLALASAAMSAGTVLLVLMFIRERNAVPGRKAA